VSGGRCDPVWQVTLRSTGRVWLLKSYTLPLPLFFYKQRAGVHTSTQQGVIRTIYSVCSYEVIWGKTSSNKHVVVYLRSTCRYCNDTVTLQVNEHSVTKVLGWVIFSDYSGAYRSRMHDYL